MTNKLLAILVLAYFPLFSWSQSLSASQNTLSRLVFAGDYPDPSILVDGNTYYMVHSSFDYYPGLLIWKSADLKSWTPVANALHKYVGSVWAPDLIKFEGKYYIYFPANNTNYVVTARNIEGPWSDPVNLNIGNIDPGHVDDGKGNRYLYFSNGGYVPLSRDGLRVSGELKHTYDGWKIPQSWSIECFCMEGPKLTKRGNYYYLTVAEGGTAGPATGHMIISARSLSPLGPWENSPHNPILRASSASERWVSTGHGTLFKGLKDKWYMVYHAYEKDHYNMGRQTLISPVTWTDDGWYKLQSGSSAITTGNAHSEGITSQGFGLSDPLTGSHLNLWWKFYGKPDSARYTLSAAGIEIKGRGDAVGNSAPLVVTPSHHSYSVEVEATIRGEASAGLMLFYNNAAFSGILADQNDVLANLRGWQFVTESGVLKGHVFLKLEKRDQVVNMFYSTSGNKWTKISNSAEVSGLHHNVLGGFLSLKVALFSVGKGSVVFRNFKYIPL